VTAELAASLRALAAALPAGSAVTVPRERLLELLAAAGDVPDAVSSADPTVEAVATRYGRAASTVRGWCESGRFPGAYKLHDREWRIPVAALEAFDDAARGRESPAGRHGRRIASLGDWRRSG
jgi:hypothetical protein